MIQDETPKKTLMELIFDGFTAEEKDDMMEMQKGEYQMWRLGVKASALRRMKQDKEQQNPDAKRRKK